MMNRRLQIAEEKAWEAWNDHLAKCPRCINNGRRCRRGKILEEAWQKASEDLVSGK